MNKFYYLIATTILATVASTASAMDNVERVKSRQEYKKALVKKNYQGKSRFAVTSVSETTVDLPWFENFEDESTFDLFTVIDANDDWSTWEWSEGKAQYFPLFADESADDWLITPGFNMAAGKNYSISFRANAYDFNAPEEFSAWLGNAPETEAMTISVVEKTIVAQDNSVDFNVVITVPEDGVYYLGIHCSSKSEEAYFFEIDDISIKEGPMPDAPDAVSDLEIIPDPEGALKTTISFSTPTLTTAGASLSSLTKVEIYLDDTNLIKTFDSPCVGEQLTYVDENPSNGDNHYTIIAYNEVGEGKSAKLSLFVGEDSPSVPQNFTLKVVDSDVVLTWEDLPLGWNGHYVNTSKLTYDIWESPDGINLTEVAKGVKEKTYTIKGRAEQGNQQQTVYVIRAISSCGEGNRGTSNSVILGKSENLPFEESFADKKLHFKWFLSSKDSKAGAATVEESQDGDGGSIKISGKGKGSVIDLMSSKIWIKDAQKLHLNFWYRSPADAKLSVGLSKDLNDIKVVNLEASDEWKQAHIDLSDMGTNDYAQIVFRYTVGAGVEPCYIDNINLSSTTLGIDNVNSSNDVKVVEKYNINGVRVSDNYRGVVIERLSDGTYRKNVIE